MPILSAAPVWKLSVLPVALTWVLPEGVIPPAAATTRLAALVVAAETVIGPEFAFPSVIVPAVIRPSLVVLIASGPPFTSVLEPRLMPTPLVSGARLMVPVLALVVMEPVLSICCMLLAFKEMLPVGALTLPLPSNLNPKLVLPTPSLPEIVTLPEVDLVIALTTTTPQLLPPVPLPPVPTTVTLPAAVETIWPPLRPTTPDPP